MITPNLFQFQRETYPLAHASRKNLVIHALTQPVFVLGLAALAGGLGTLHLGAALAGLVAMAFAAAAQGAGHKGEANPPAPFRSKLDIVARLFAEQFVTFPRFVLSGGFAMAWRGSALGPEDRAEQPEGTA